MNLYTKNGKPLQSSNNIVYSLSGKVIGRIKNNKVYWSNGKYVGTIVNDILVYRWTDSAAIIPPFLLANTGGIIKASRVGSAIWWDEPNIPN